MDILNKLLLKDLQEIAKVMEIETTAGQKKDDLKRLISHSLEENNTVLAYGTLLFRSHIDTHREKNINLSPIENN